MYYIRFHLPILLSSIVTGDINYKLLRLYSVCLIFLSQTISSSSKFDDRALTMVKSFDGYLCQNYVYTCFFRQRYHQSFDNQQQSDKCKSLLILHSCIHYDTDIITVCEQSTLNRAKINLNNETPRHCFTSSVYKTFYNQHLHSIAPSRTIVKCQIFVLFFLLISFVIKIRACC